MTEGPHKNGNGGSAPVEQFEGPNGVYGIRPSRGQWAVDRRYPAGFRRYKWAADRAAARRKARELAGLPKQDYRDLTLRWIDAHPQSWRLFVEHALEAKRSGHRIGAKAIVERLRWSHHVERAVDEEWEWNNSLTAYLAREAMRRVPELDGYFQTRSVSQ